MNTSPHTRWVWGHPNTSPPSASTRRDARPSVPKCGRGMGEATQDPSSAISKPVSVPPFEATARGESPSRPGVPRSRGRPAPPEPPPLRERPRPRRSPTPGTPACPRSPAPSSAARWGRTRVSGAASPSPSRFPPCLPPCFLLSWCGEEDRCSQPCAPRRCAADKDNKDPAKLHSGAGSGRFPARRSRSPAHPEVRRGRAAPVRAPFPSGRGYSLEETSGHWFPARPASWEVGKPPQQHRLGH